jgi:hypothetical protein
VPPERGTISRSSLTLDSVCREQAGSLAMTWHAVPHTTNRGRKAGSLPATCSAQQTQALSQRLLIPLTPLRLSNSLTRCQPLDVFRTDSLLDGSIPSQRQHLLTDWERFWSSGLQVRSLRVGLVSVLYWPKASSQDVLHTGDSLLWISVGAGAFTSTGPTEPTTMEATDV